MNSLKYHKTPVPGKTEVIPTKRCKNQHDLAMAYTPGVADPCREIKKNPSLAGIYTNRNNLVAVITDGSAVLGLGKIGPLAGKPVMEGKAVLFKRFADIDVFDIELGTHDPDKIIETVSLLEPTFGGINLEDIKAPECFYIEEELKKRMSIPVFHDDQHGTAIITAAALLNALEITGKSIEKVRIVVNGAGAAGISCSKMYLDMGIKKENLIMCDSKGVIYRGREEGMNPHKESFAASTPSRTLAEAVVGTDIFLGLSVKGALSPEMLKTMNRQPVVFALANPDPEISPSEAIAARNDVIIATGRSDFPNQVNNVLGFPFIFRGALDVQASCINEQMKIAAAKAIADLAKRTIPNYIRKAYNRSSIEFGPDYLIPMPFDNRVFYDVSTAVAEAAFKSGVSGIPFKGREQYQKELKTRYDLSIRRFTGKKKWSIKGK